MQPDPLDPAIRRVFTLMAESEGPAFSGLLEAIERDHESFPTVEQMDEWQIKLWDTFQQCRPELGGQTPHAQLIAWAWMAQAFRQTRSTFRLVSDGFADSACANARSAFEHGIYISVLADVPDVDLVLDRLERRYIDIGKRLAKGEPPDEAAQSLLINVLDKWSESASEVDLTSDWVPWMRRVCNRLVDGDIIYGHYSGLSTQMHCGFGSAEGFLLSAFNAGTPEEPVLTHEPIVYSTLLMRWASLGACAWAGWSVDKLFGFDNFSPTCDLLRSEGFQPLRLKPRA